MRLSLNDPSLYDIIQPTAGVNQYVMFLLVRVLSSFKNGEDKPQRRVQKLPSSALLFTISFLTATGVLVPSLDHRFIVRPSVTMRCMYENIPSIDADRVRCLKSLYFCDDVSSNFFYSVPYNCYQQGVRPYVQPSVTAPRNVQTARVAIETCISHNAL